MSANERGKKKQIPVKHPGSCQSINDDSFRPIAFNRLKKSLTLFDKLLREKQTECIPPKEAYTKGIIHHVHR